MEQEHNDAYGNDDGFLNQTVFEGIDRFADEFPPVVTGNDLDARWQRRFDLSKLLLNAIDYVKSVEAVAHDDDAADGFAVSIPLRYASTRVPAPRHPPPTHPPTNTPAPP